MREPACVDERVHAAAHDRGVPPLEGKARKLVVREDAHPRDGENERAVSWTEGREVASGSAQGAVWGAACTHGTSGR